MSPAENEKLPKKQLEERSIKLTENSVLRNKPLKGKNSYYIVDAHPGKITESIILDEPDDSNKTEQNIAISEHPVQPQNSNNSVTIWHRKKKDNFSKKLERLYTEIEAVNVHKWTIFHSKKFYWKYRCQKWKPRNKYETLYSEYESSETEDTSSDSASEMSTNNQMVLFKKDEKEDKNPAGTEINSNSAETRHQGINATTENNKKQRINKENRSYRREKSNNLTRNASPASNDSNKPKNTVIFSKSIL